MINYKNSKNKGFRYVFVIIDNSSNYLWTMPLKNKHSQTITQEFSNILTNSKRSPLKLENDRGAEFYESICQTFLKRKIYNFFQESQTKVSQKLTSNYIVY